jgi:hypothetical protein
MTGAYGARCALLLAHWELLSTIMLKIRLLNVTSAVGTLLVLNFVPLVLLAIRMLMQPILPSGNNMRADSKMSMRRWARLCTDG